MSPDGMAGVIACDYYVYYRKDDGKGIQTLKSGLTQAEALAEVNRCFGAIADATMFMIVQHGTTTSLKWFLRENTA